MTLPLRDTSVTYGRVSRLLHWLIAAMILWQFVGMILREVLDRNAVSGFFVGSHQPVGTLIFLLVVVRVIWALSNRANRPPHDPGLLGLAARLGHLALYAMMFLVPFAAILRAWGSTRGFAPFGFTIFPPQAETVAWANALGDGLHGALAWVMAAFIIGHIAMAILHHRLWRDQTLLRMAGRPRDPGTRA